MTDNTLHFKRFTLNKQRLTNWYHNHKTDLLYSAISLFSGLLYAAALPPFNQEYLAYIMLVPLLWVITRRGVWFSALCGWHWGIGWGFFAYCFLREIDWMIPFLLPPVIAVWSAVWAGLVSFISSRKKECTEKHFVRQMLFIFGSAALFTLLEWTRSRLFVWNDTGVTQWRNLPLIQLAAVTGSYGVNFLVVLGNTAIFSMLKKRTRLAGAIALIPIIAVMIWGYCRIQSMEKAPLPKAVWKPVLIQGDLSQRRHATLDQAKEALDIYGTLSLEAIKKYNSGIFIIWPESAIPLTYYTTVDLRKYKIENPHALNTLRYQELVRLLTSNYRSRMLIGALDYAPEAPGSRKFAATNSALFFDENGKLQRKYDKIHRVPFGEYIPFRRFIPKFITDYIDMGRDIASGTDFVPMALAQGVNAGVVICYEGVFGYITRQSARANANILIAISNDAWYPVSSEPEQHLANAVMRSVETGLHMIRSGNNGGSGVVTPTGRFTQCYTPEQGRRPELWRGRTINQVTVPISPETHRTFYVRHGEFFIIFLAITAAAWTALSFYRKSEENKK